MSDRIEKTIELNATVARVWRALTDHREFGAWFRVKLDAPFVVGQTARGPKLRPGMEHVTWEATVQKMEHERLFSFTWRPYSIDPKIDYSKEPPTLVEFTLEAVPADAAPGTAARTRLTVVESGFDRVPSERRPIAFRSHQEGWAEQMQNVERHVSA